MALVSGPEVDELVQDLQEWWNSELAWLMEQLSQGYPFGAQPLSEAEQLEEYHNLRGNPGAWQALILQREGVHRGRPDMRQVVQAELDSYVRRMQALEQKRLGGASA